MTSRVVIQQLITEVFISLASATVTHTVPNVAPKAAQPVKKKKTPKISSTNENEKNESWLKKCFFGLLYYRSERKFHFNNGPKVKLPRSRHK